MFRSPRFGLLLLTVDSTFAFTPMPLSVALVLSGQPGSAIRTIEPSERFNRNVPVRRKFLLFIYATAGRWSDVERIRAQVHQPSDLLGDLDDAFVELLLGNYKPLVRLLSTPAGQRRWKKSVFFGCNAILDPLWSDKRFVAAMGTLSVARCPLARAWPVARHP